jgi:hypothetical protein
MWGASTRSILAGRRCALAREGLVARWQEGGYLALKTSRRVCEAGKLSTDLMALRPRSIERAEQLAVKR